jgi:serine phosphatase RsbU (regulator of sigma subunit)
MARHGAERATGKMKSETAKKTVLLVDDAPTNIRMVNAILRERYRVIVATNGPKALEMAADSPGPDLILLDVVMPEMDGYAVCKHLKSDASTRDIPVIFLTGQTEYADEARGFAAGAVDYIHKPFSAPLVAARVETHLTLRETRERLEQQLRAIRDELETARAIQQTILPREAPQIAGLDIAARYIPMSSVAGDFYDFIPIDQHRLGVLVADVSGHGMPAALVASMLKVAFAAQVDRAGDPAGLLLGLNRALFGKFKGHYVTAAYAVIDLERKLIHYAGAGHPPLVLWDRQSARARALLQNGLFLGYFPEAEFSAAEAPFREGDWLVLYTDGISEMRNAVDEQFGQTRLQEFVEEENNLTADAFADRLLARLDQWSGSLSAEGPEDDITLVAIHFQAAP